MEVITDHCSEFVNTHSDERPVPDHAFERYLDENAIKHTLCKVGRPQSKRKIERFYQTYEIQRRHFKSLCNFIEYYNTERPHKSPLYDELEKPE